MNLKCPQRAWSLMGESDREEVKSKTSGEPWDQVGSREYGKAEILGMSSRRAALCLGLEDVTSWGREYKLVTLGQGM